MTATANSMSPTQFYHTTKGQTPLLTAFNYAGVSNLIWLRAENLWHIVIGTEKARQSPAYEVTTTLK